MQITETKVKVSALCEGYRDDGDGDVYGEVIRFLENLTLIRKENVS